MSWEAKTTKSPVVTMDAVRNDERLGTLAAALYVLGREPEIWMSATDTEFRKKLYKEFGLDGGA